MQILAVPNKDFGTFNTSRIEQSDRTMEVMSLQFSFGIWKICQRKTLWMAKDQSQNNVFSV